MIFWLSQQPVPFALYNNCIAAVNELLFFILLMQKKLAKLLNLCSVFPNSLCWTLLSFTFLNFSPSQIIREVAKKVAQIQNGKSTLPLFVSMFLRSRVAWVRFWGILKNHTQDCK